MPGTMDLVQEPLREAGFLRQAIMVLLDPAAQ